MNEITSLDDLDSFIESTNDTPVLIFKHSTTCPISSRASDRVKTYMANSDNTPPVALVKVIESRPISNAIAERFHIQHQSPQIILVNKGEGIWNVSHHNITAENIEEALQKL